ncbi:CHAD domain-containing protein [Aliiglaciecola sp. LCG003]|uniref:CHAD domain-containing protein n=1 Tax=Aliiglaciecola sp. LCG003 TaxID=3053655 RepID=UPI002573D031|nr:CHAD domain-containing protein [Aliiglaciecola sp. LCG003]WJG08601.1 CHAD domain-containing protein [Aliiglaciecola sp. LCG003]
MKKSSIKSDPLIKLAKKRVNALQKAMADSQASSNDLSVEAVHELRVCSKNLRALLQLYRPFCNKIILNNVEQLVKALADSYAGQRDADVQYELVCQAIEALAKLNDKTKQFLLRYFVELRHHANEKSRIADVRAQLEQLLLVWKQELTLSLMTDCSQGLQFSYQKSRKLALKAAITDKDDKYHQCRKWVKYYLYQSRMLHSNKNAKNDMYLNQLAILGDLLGKLHDYCVLEQSLTLILTHSARQKFNSIEARSIEVAISQIQAWLAEQKRLNKSQCQTLFKHIFSHSKSPIKIR